MLSVIGAGAMGTAVAMQAARAGAAPVILATQFDGAVLAARRAGAPHPALAIRVPDEIDCMPHDRWRDILARSEVVVVAVSSDGMAGVVREAASQAREDTLWVVVTKGWDETTLRSPSEVVATEVGPADALAVLGGPALAPEVVAGAPTAMVCASRSTEVARRVARLLESPSLSIVVSDDVAGVETAAAFKNVVAVAVGICEGIADAQVEGVFRHACANARAAVFALGLRDMVHLAEARGGRAETVVGLAGAGDLYVTCLGGRNGRLGRLLGAGETLEQATAAIGSTVEGVANTHVALALAERLGLDLPSAGAVQRVVTRQQSPEAAVDEMLRALRSSS